MADSLFRTRGDLQQPRRRNRWGTVCVIDVTSERLRELGGHMCVLSQAGQEGARVVVCVCVCVRLACQSVASCVFAETAQGGLSGRREVRTAGVFYN